MKTCIVCNEKKSLSDFDALKKYPNKFLSICKKCSENKKINDSKKDEFIKKSRAVSDYYFRTYKLRHGSYAKMLKLQDGKCLICKTEESQLNKKLVVDHCHTTGKVRGLLCSLCNSGLGFFKDNPKILENAITYLENSRENSAARY